MSRDRSAEAAKRKQRETEPLDVFLARMTVLWHERQARYDAAIVKGAEAAKRHADKRRAEDPEGWRLKRLEAVKRYEQRHPERIAAKKERDRLRRARLAAALAISQQIVKAEKAAQRAADLERKRSEKAAKRAVERRSAGSVSPRTWMTI